jgi:hypothetical protein
MTVTRRTAVLHAVALGAACALPPVVGVGPRAAAATRAGDAGVGPVPGPSLADWKSLVGSEVHVVRRPGLILRVDEVKDLSRTTRRNRMPGHGDVFTISFAQRSGPALHEGTHILHHPALGHSALFLSSTGRQARYQAVVNAWLPTERQRKGSAR